VKIVKKIGAGAYGIVYLAEYNSDDVAVKKLRAMSELGEDVGSDSFSFFLNKTNLRKFIPQLKISSSK
jgi:hypothetical protein